MSRPSSTISLKTSPLLVYSNGLALSPHHKKMLLEKKREFQDTIKTKKNNFDLEAQEYLEKLTLKHNSQNEAYRKLRATQQSRLEDLQERCQERLNELFHRFQREWMTNQQTQEKESAPYNGSEHGAYIASTVGRALELGLTEVCLYHPEDPIEFLANWLKTYSLTLQRKEEEAAEAMQLQLAKEEQHLIEDHQRTLRIEIGNIAQEEHRRKEEYLKVAKTVSETDQSDSLHADAHTNHLDSLQPPSMMSYPVPAGVTISSSSAELSDDIILMSPAVSPIEDDDAASYKSDDSRGMAVLYTIHEKSTEEHEDV